MRITLSIAGVQQYGREIKRNLSDGRKLGVVLRRNAQDIVNDFERFFLEQIGGKGETHVSDQQKAKGISFRDEFREAIRPHVKTEKSGKYLKRATVTMGQESVLQGEKFILRRKWDGSPNAEVDRRGNIRSRVARTSRPDERTHGNVPTTEGYLVKIKAPGSKSVGYQGGTKEVLWWQLFDKGVQAHYIYSGKMFGAEDAPYLRFKDRPTPARLLVTLHPGFKALHFFRKIASNVTRGKYGLYRDLGSWTREAIRKSGKSAKSASRKR